MGLAMVKGIVDDSGGNISVSSTGGAGTLFVVHLPIVETELEQEEKEKEELPRGSERILLVDDEAPICRMGQRILQGLGYTVVTSNSGEAALELFRESREPFDLVITDMTMPKMSGDQLIKELRTINEGISAILCTGYSSQISEEEALGLGINGFAYKPVTREDYAKIVREVLDSSPEKN